MPCCGDTSLVSTTPPAPPPPPPASNCCLRTRYTCQCIAGVDTWVLDVIATECLANNLCVGGASCTDKEFVSEVIDGCVCADPLPVLPTPTCAPHCCEGVTTTTTTTTPAPSAPCTDCAGSQSATVSGFSGGCSGNNGSLVFSGFGAGPCPPPCCSWSFMGAIGAVLVTYNGVLFTVNGVPAGGVRCVGGRLTGTIPYFIGGCGPPGLITFGP